MARAAAGTPLGVAIAGCGNIAGRYAQQLRGYPGIRLLGATDLDGPRAEAFAAEHGCRAYPSLDAALADAAVALVVNLTTHHAHYAVSKAALEAGKHVYSEKPLALTTPEARDLVTLARDRGLRLGGSPATFMGEAQQTAWKAIREGGLGPVRLIYAEVNWNRLETWHPSPGAFYAVGPLFDVGVYPLTLMTTFFGPARRVWAYGKVLYPDRTTKEGATFHIETPDFVTALVELEGGVVMRLTTNFYVGRHGKQKGIEIHGDRGSLYLGSFQDFHTPVEAAEFNGEYRPVPYVKEPYQGTEWARGVFDLVEALREDRPHRATGEQAAHVVEILNAITAAIEHGGTVEIASSFTPPPPMGWGR